MIIADVGSKDKTAVVGLDNCAVDKAVVVDILIVVYAASWLPHTILKFPFDPPVDK